MACSLMIHPSISAYVDLSDLNPHTEYKRIISARLYYGL